MAMLIMKIWYLLVVLTLQVAFAFQSHGDSGSSSWRTSLAHDDEIDPCEGFFQAKQLDDGYTVLATKREDTAEAGHESVGDEIGRENATPSFDATAGASPLQMFWNAVVNSRRHLVAAAVARGTSMFLTYPLDTIKTRIQMGQSNALRMDGILSGVAGSLLGQIPYGVLTFGSYEIYKSMLIEKASTVLNITNATSSSQYATPPAMVAIYALAAILGDLTGSFWLCPSEVIKQQMQAGMYDSMGGAVQTIWETKGALGFYAGYFSAISRDVLFRMLQLTSFEVTKNVVLQWKVEQKIVDEPSILLPPKAFSDSSSGEEEEQPQPNNEDRLVMEKVELSTLEAAFCGAIAGTFAAALTSPLDRIKTLLMTNSDAYGGSILVCAKKIIRNEGWQNMLFQGMVPRVTYIAPAVMIFFVVYEWMRQQLEIREEKEKNKAGSSMEIR